MIVWLNGPFGGGKTTLAAGLSRALPGVTVAEPEAVGDLLRSTLAGHALRPKDYQDLPLWRQLTGAFVAGLVRHTVGPVIVPMAVLNPAYAEEIFTPLRQADGGFHHLVVHATPAALQERIAASREFPGDEARSEAVRAYRRRRAADYEQAAAGWMHADGRRHRHQRPHRRADPRRGSRPPATSGPRAAPITGGTTGMTVTIHPVPGFGHSGRRPSPICPGRARGARS